VADAGAWTTPTEEKILTPITNGEIMAFASKKCRICFGEGIARKITSPSTSTMTVCGCAFRRFEAKAGPDVMYDHKTGAWYRVTAA